MGGIPNAAPLMEGLPPAELPVQNSAVGERLLSSAWHPLATAAPTRAAAALEQASGDPRLWGAEPSAWMDVQCADHTVPKSDAGRRFQQGPGSAASQKPHVPWSDVRIND